MAKIVITGGRGQLAYDCDLVLREKHDIILLGAMNLDISDPVAVQNSLWKYKPDLVLNCAAYTRVDDCETEKKKAWRVNAEGPENLAAGMEARGGRVIHISTDYVFDGRRRVPTGYTETDYTNPLSYYGKTKLAGEAAVRQRNSDSLIIRTAWLYGVHGHNFFKTMLKLAMMEPGREIRVVNDQYSAPTWTHRLAEQIDALIDAEASGTYHATDEGYASWYECARFFLEQMGVEHRIAPCTTSEYPTRAHRPVNSILENRRLQQQSLNLMRDWRQDMIEFVQLHGQELRLEVMV
jgi:dTDP-4-dehydrorhamnose reductase